MLRNATVPHIFSQDNEDGTKEVVAGDFDPFTVIIVQDGSASVTPAEKGNYGYYSYGETLPSDVKVDVSR